MGTFEKPLVVRSLSRAAFERNEPCQGCGVGWLSPEIDHECGSLLQLFVKGPRSLDETEPNRRGRPHPIIIQGPDYQKALARRLIVEQLSRMVSLTTNGRRVARSYLNDQKRYEQQHKDCQAHRESAGGPTHCGHCCPPPPLAENQLRTVWRILDPDHDYIFDMSDTPGRDWREGKWVE